MEIRYRHNVRNNYVVIKNSNICINDYRLNMVLKNSIYGLLDMYVGCVDGEVELSYIISSRQSIKDLYEKKKMTYEDIRNIIKSVIKVCHEVQRYLLKLGDVIFDTELVYFDYKNREAAFCYCPNRGCEPQYEIRNFVQDLMKMTDHEDRKAVEIIYGIFDICNKDNFLISDIEEYIGVGHADNCKKQVQNDIYGESVKYNGDMEQQVERLCDKVCEGNDTGYRVSELPKQGVYEQDMKSIFKNNMLLKKLTGVFGKERQSNTGVPVKEYEAEVRKDNENNSGRELSEDGYLSDDTMYIKDIISGTTRKLLSLTEKDNIEITSYPFIIGKLGSRVDCIIEERSISRIHVKISKDDEGNYYIEDMNSKNGTYLNGIPAEPHEKIKIEIGDKIRIATFEYIFR